MEIIERAKLFEKQGEKQKAAKAYLQAVTESGETWAAVKAGDIYFELGMLDMAKEAYAFIVDCGIYPLYDRLIEFYIKIKDYGNASQLFEKCFPFASSSQKIVFGDRLFDLKAYKQAEYWYLSAVEKFHEDKNPYLTKVGEYKEKFGFVKIKKITKADEYFYEGNYKLAAHGYNSAKKSSKYAKTKAAECYFLLKEFDNAKTLYRELVQETDDSYYMFMLAECYNGEEVDENTLENAVYWYEYALEKGSVYPYYHLGICYQFGRGTEENLQKAIELYKKGAKEKIDCANCLCKLGNIYYNKGMIFESTEYYRRAASLGNARSLLNIAILYFNEEISVFSFDEIRCFLSKAAALGSKRAYEMMEEIGSA